MAGIIVFVYSEDENNHIQTTYVDEYGNTRWSESPEGSQTLFTYDDLDRLISVRNLNVRGADQETFYAYDQAWPGN